MSVTICKIKLLNYKRFKGYTIIPNKTINILVGDNEVGKSSILDAIDIVACGNIRRVDAIGIDKLLNLDAVNQFMCGSKEFETLPKMIIELYLEGELDHTVNGKNNTEERKCDGIRLVCEPNHDYYSEIIASITANGDYFPYDYYKIRFSTFSDEGYSGYKKKIKSIIIDSSNMNSEYATNDYIKRVYNQYTEDYIAERAVHRSCYRQLKNGFCSENLHGLNQRIAEKMAYSFGLKIGSSLCLENDLMIYEDSIGIDSKGTGKQVFIKTEFALKKAGENIDVVLIEEPENHLSHINLRNLIQSIAETHSGQLFITTHSSLICTRLNLRNLMIMHIGEETRPTTLSALNIETEKYFCKAPVANVVEFSLSKKVILVEGPSEYMLFEKFYSTISGNKPEADAVNIMEIHGLSFKRYLEIAQLLGSKVAVVTDNDHNIQRNCIDKYEQYSGYPQIEVFYDNNEQQDTFEKTLYIVNQELCDRLFRDNACEYMLKNKTEAAYILLDHVNAIAVPDYIERSIKWINE